MYIFRSFIGIFIRSVWPLIYILHLYLPRFRKLNRLAVDNNRHLYEIARKEVKKIAKKIKISFYLYG